MDDVFRRSQCRLIDKVIIRGGMSKMDITWGGKSGEHTENMIILMVSTLWLFNIAMENGPFIDGLLGFTH